jgi:hypothetical protein
MHASIAISNEFASYYLLKVTTLLSSSTSSTHICNELYLVQTHISVNSTSTIQTQNLRSKFGVALESSNTRKRPNEERSLFLKQVSTTVTELTK